MSNLLFLDLESTGNRPDDQIVEIGALLVSEDLSEVLDEFTCTIDPGLEGWAKIRSLAVVAQMHHDSGLWDDLEARRNMVGLAEAEAKLLSWFDDIEPITIAGSGVANFDKPLVERWMPELASRLTYFTHDVGHLRRQYRTATGHLLTPIDSTKTHRAIDDVRCHLAEARIFRAMFRFADSAMMWAATNPGTHLSSTYMAEFKGVL